MPAVAAAFLRQLPQWRSDFSEATQRHDTNALADLIHKMKGSCHALAAHDAAVQLEQAEQSVEHATAAAWPRQYNALLTLIQEIENELLSVMAAQTRT